MVSLLDYGNNESKINSISGLYCSKMSNTNINITGNLFSLACVANLANLKNRSYLKITQFITNAIEKSNQNILIAMLICKNSYHCVKHNSSKYNLREHN